MSFDLTPPPAPAPIADLSYRGYAGPLNRRTLRWWYITSISVRLMLRKWAFWVLAGISILPFVMLGVLTYELGQARQGMIGSSFGGNFQALFAQQLASAQALQYLWLLFVGLLGAGAIAADNAANALLVYLSRPLTRFDYLVGKWLGLFLPLYGIALAPSLLLYAFLATAFTGPNGCFAADRLMVFRLLLTAAIPAAVHSSALLGLSAWSKSGRMAGAIWAGFYFVSFITSNIVGFIEFAASDRTRQSVAGRMNVPALMGDITHRILHVSNQVNPLTGGGFRRFVPPHETWPMLLAPLAVLVVIGWLAAAMRVRAVEVVRG
ncbi:MAG: ABC transporter permease subunit [Armatimonadetes bacterium]|nr:ABC transporter permease subunit [Armatimonadota bacterium]MDE2205052.1 ABC transporter permease subunit [Armatimonadota bacterium]